ncbi:MAG: PIN domain-containing protein [Fibromonadaceae bacterium]|jgi:predicted nucleic acid-binding protein|nr:PIN domain-containing protein [Fibromonadaceae bacterium]
MLISYFDSSLLLSILLNEARSEEALAIWQNNKVRISSILLKFEMNISLRRRIKQQKSIFSDERLKIRLQDLNKFLNDIFYIDITENLESSASRNYDILSKCKSLDAIHIATALDISDKYGISEICICSFDKNMLKIAKELGFETN